jgi:hypothetical protein
MKDVLTGQFSSLFHFPEAHHADIVLLTSHFLGFNLREMVHRFGEFFHLAEAFDELHQLHQEFKQHEEEEDTAETDYEPNYEYNENGESRKVDNESQH